MSVGLLKRNVVNSTFRENNHEYQTYLCGTAFTHTQLSCSFKNLQISLLQLFANWSLRKIFK